MGRTSEEDQISYVVEYFRRIWRRLPKKIGRPACLDVHASRYNLNRRSISQGGRLR